MSKVGEDIQVAHLLINKRDNFLESTLLYFRIKTETLSQNNDTLRVEEPLCNQTAFTTQSKVSERDNNLSNVMSQLFVIAAQRHNKRLIGDVSS